MMLRPLALVALACAAQAKVYNLLRNNQGAHFFDAFQFFGTFDTVNGSPTADFLNSGDDFMANRSYAMSAGLTSVNQAGHAIIRVDDTSTVVFNEKRFSVRINTSETYSPGNVFVLEATHIPFGCSVWPAYWTAAKTWPTGGEIDIMEQVNLATNNQMSLHTSPGCTIPQSNTGMTGSVQLTNCGDTDTNAGCIIKDASTDSFSTFNQAGGGMWVTEFASTGISTWFYNKASIPQALLTSANASSIDTTQLGTPSGTWPATNCEIATFFQPQSIVLDISLCGVFGRPTFNATCPATRDNACYLDWVIGPPGNYTEAFFEIVSLRVFNDGSPNSFQGPVTSPDLGTSGGGSGGSSSGGSSGGGSSGGGLSGGGNGLGAGAATARWSAGAGVAVLAVAAMAAALAALV